MARPANANPAAEPKVAPWEWFNLHPRLGVALVFLLTLVAYWPALRGAFIWNDKDYVTAPALRSLAGLGEIWFKPGATEQYYPALHSFFWLQHRLWGDSPLGYHVVTLLLHIGAASLLALVLRRLAVPGAWLAALLFALHPVHVESVAWITEQKNTVSLVFYLAVARVYLDYDETRRTRTYWAALGLFVVSLLCKTVTATLPAALLVVFWWKRGRLEIRRDVAPLLPWFAIGAASGMFTSWVERHYVGAEGADFVLSLVERGLVAGRAIWFYLGNLAWPFDLNFIYPRWTPDASVWWQWLFPLGVLVLAGALWALRGRTRAPLAVFLLFVGSLFPVLGFVNLYGALYSWVWDHWQYLPDLAPLALVAAGLTAGWAQVPPRWRPWGPVLAGLLVLGLGTLSWRHMRMFQDDTNLFRMTLARNPAAWMAHVNLANLLCEAPGQEDEAIFHYKEAFRLHPDYPEAHVDLAILLSRLPGRQAEARENLEQALRIWPSYADAHHYLASLLIDNPASAADALSHEEEAVRLKPDYDVAQYNLGVMLAGLPERRPEALAHFEQALRLNPKLNEAHYQMARILVTLPNRETEAIAHYEAALQANPGLASAHLNLGVILTTMPGRLPDAIAHFEAAVRLNPNDATAHYNLGVALMQSPSRVSEGIHHFQEVLRIHPDDFEMHFELGNILSELPGRKAEAPAHYEAALRLNPGFAPARERLEQLRANSPQAR